MKNNIFGMIKWKQMVFRGEPGLGVDFQPIDFADLARACGAIGFSIDDPARCGVALDRALAKAGPVVVEAVVDFFEPPMPPRITMDQARGLVLIDVDAV